MISLRTAKARSPGARALGAPVVLAVALTAGVAVIVVAQLIAYAAGEPLATLTRDMQVTADVPWYTGAVNVLNGKVWAATGALALFVAWLRPAGRPYLAAFGAFVLVLAADDALLIHDAAGPRNGIPQEAFLLVYALTALALAAWLLRAAPRDVAVVFICGAAFLAGSILFDQLVAGHHAVEDGAKLLGALTWLTVPVLAGQPRPRRDAAEAGAA